MKKGQIVEGIIERVDFPNKGILRAEDGTRVIVKNAIMGQKVSAAVNKVRKGKCEGRLLEVLEKSALELPEPGCVHYGICGGCTFQSLPYEEQLSMKEQQVKDLIDAVITEENKGGLVANVKGIRVFIPASQSGIAKGGDMAGMVGKTVQLKITEVNRARRRVIGSIRAVNSEARKAAQEKIWSEIEVGKQYHGTVKSLTSYGAFVDIGGVDGMVHVSELSWNRIKHPSEVVSVGDTIEVYVKDIDTENHKVSLGYKKAEDNPWEQLKNNYPIGSTFHAPVVSLTKFGAFVRILPGVDGLVHISEISNDRVEKVSDALKVGDMVDVKLLDVDFDKKRISLSMKALLNDDAE